MKGDGSYIPVTQMLHIAMTTQKKGMTGCEKAVVVYHREITTHSKARPIQAGINNHVAR